jgi:hypothetical protein
MWIWIGVFVVVLGTIFALFPNAAPAKVTVPVRAAAATPDREQLVGAGD